MSLLLSRRGRIGRASGTPTVPSGSSANVVLAKAIGSASGSGTSLAVALGTAPSAGRLIVVAAYAGNSSDIAVSGLTTVAASNAGNGVTGIFAKIAVGGESASWTVTASGSGVMRAEIMEWSPGAGAAWSSALTHDVAGSTAGSGFSGTVTAIEPSAGPTFAIAAMGVGSAVFARTWTNGFTWDGIVIDRFSVATKKSTVAETISTTESWDTSRAYRGALAAFQLTPA